SSEQQRQIIAEDCAAERDVTDVALSALRDHIKREVSQLNRHQEQLEERIAKAFNDRHYPRIFDFGPDEISRYILDFINPIHSPPTTYERWLRNMKKKWCPKCGELCYPRRARCRTCKKYLSWNCSNCTYIYPSISCNPRRYPPEPGDSDYSSSEEYF
ncbi:MAG: hypothetical protein CMM25_02935, partial [Rhodospirillaceae bacterium]|nr:hypothetical protein [Rhodospirillaceae bacterium]